MNAFTAPSAGRSGRYPIRWPSRSSAPTVGASSLISRSMPISASMARWLVSSS
ncbi:MAG: hypothetical protein IPL61_38865 [Myxococcales bacterium]|nr:hypothetical protein [Myxococcales bacterium]